MPLSLRRYSTATSALQAGPLHVNHWFVISRKLWLALITSTAAILTFSGLSGCSFASDNVPDVYQPNGAAAQSTPQVPESMKTNDTGEGPKGPPQGL